MLYVPASKGDTREQDASEMRAAFGAHRGWQSCFAMLLLVVSLAGVAVGAAAFALSQSALTASTAAIQSSASVQTMVTYLTREPTMRPTEAPPTTAAPTTAAPTTAAPTTSPPCPTGWTSFSNGTLCSKRMQPAAFVPDAQKICTTYGADVCSVGQYYFMETALSGICLCPSPACTASTSIGCWTNQYVGSTYGVFVTVGGGWNTVIWNTALPYFCCIARPVS